MAPPPAQHGYHYHKKPTYMNTMTPPEREYLPPSSMNIMSPPEKDYLPPEPQKHVGSSTYNDKHLMHPPQENYLPPQAMRLMSPPHAGYLPPDKMKNMSPPHQEYKTPKEVHSDMDLMGPPHQDYSPPKKMVYMEPPKENYLPPDDLKHMSVPEKGYLPPNHSYKSVHHMTTMKPPDQKYVPPKSMKHMSPPENGYLAPLSNYGSLHQMTTMKPPAQKYAPPTNMKHMNPPGKDYLPPKESSTPLHKMTTMHPPVSEYKSPKNLKYMSPPEAAYLSPVQSYKIPHEMKIMNPPELEYSPPKHMRQHISPPEKGYISPPRQKYGIPHKMSTMAPPKSEYIPPKDMKYMAPPETDYLPPQKNGYELPAPQKMKTMSPPMLNYVPPKGMNHMSPPEKGYSPPRQSYAAPHEIKLMTSPKSEYLAPTIMGPPEKDYLPPSKSHLKPPLSAAHYIAKHIGVLSYDTPATYNGHASPEKLLHMSLPDKQYLPPKTMSTMKPPHKLYIPAGKSTTGNPTVAHSTPTPIPHLGKFIGTIIPATKHHHKIKGKQPQVSLLSKAHYQACPKIAEISSHFCARNSQHTCWAHGKRSLDCPLNGLCCFDGCFNSCLPPDYEHNPHLKEPDQDRNTKKTYNVVCPSLNETIHCDHYKGIQHQCSQPGISDTACPGNGLCCNNGCINICILGNHELHNVNQVHWHHHQHHHHHHGPINYYTPPHSKHLVPSSVYIPREIIHDDKGNIRHHSKDDQLAHRDTMLSEDDSLFSDPRYDGTSPAPLYVEAPHKGYDIPVPSETYLPPKASSLLELPEAKQKHAEERLIANILKGGTLEPPNEDYLPPHPQSVAKPETETNVLLTHFSPPKVHINRPSEKYLPPSKEYPHLAETHVKPSNTYLPPSIEYNNPEKVDHHAVSDLLNHEKLTHYSPPEPSIHKFQHQKYLPPSEEYDSPIINDNKLSTVEKLTHYVPPSLSIQHAPSEKYLPPSEDYHSPDKEAYQPPGLENNSPSNKYLPPSSEYVPPNNEHDQSKSKDPVKDTISDHHAASIHGPAPSLTYLPPVHEYDKPRKIEYPLSKEEEVLTHYVPPPALPNHPDAPSQTYLPPSKAHVHPPEIISPISGKHHNHQIGIDKGALLAHYSPPKQEYLPPIPFSPETAFAPPTENYLPPTDYSPQDPNGSGKKINTHGENFPFTPTDDDNVKVHRIVISDGHVHEDKKIVHPHRLPPHSINIQINIPNKDEVNIGKLYDDHHNGKKPPLLPDYVPTHNIDHSKFPVQKVMKKSDHALATLHPPSAIYTTPNPLRDSLSHIHPPKVDYLPPVDEIAGPLSGDYLPPPVPSTILDVPPEVIIDSNSQPPNIPPPPPPPEVISPDVDGDVKVSRLEADYLPPPKNPKKYEDYVPPPPRDDLSAVKLVDDLPPPPPPPPLPPAVKNLPQIFNSQALPPTTIEEAYIPPKTANDVPKNFIRPEEVPPPPPLPIIDTNDIIDVISDVEDISPPVPTAFLGLAKLKDEEEKEKVESKSENIVGEPRLPPMPTSLPPGSLLPLLNKLSPRLLQSLRGTAVGGVGMGNGRTKIPGIPGKDYPDFKFIPSTEFTCENFILEGFYADTFAGCQV